jgi:aspartate kinase
MTGPAALVVKFGGSIVGSGARIAEAANIVVKFRAPLTVVIASAPGDLTDRTLGVLSDSALPTEGPQAARVLVRAEVLGAELMAAALASRGLLARLLLPGDANWPIRLSRSGVNAPVDLPSTVSRFEELARGSAPGTVWVMPGFVGIDPEGGPATLPRGGGDTTAVVAGRSLGAPVVYLV